MFRVVRIFCSLTHLKTIFGVSIRPFNLVGGRLIVTKNATSFRRCSEGYPSFFCEGRDRPDSKTRQVTFQTFTKWPFLPKVHKKVAIRS